MINGPHPYIPKEWETVSCPFCGSPDFDQFERFGSALQYTYVQCNHCSLVYSSPRPKYDADFIEAAYGQYYQFDDNLQLNENTQVPQSSVDLFTKELQNITQYDKSKSAVLDIGSGMGTFLYSAMKYYSTLVGLDMSVQMGDWVKKTLGIDIIPIQFENYTTSQKFSLIHMSHVIEHIPNPNEWLEKAKSLLTEDGILVINVPNKYSLAARFQNLLVDLKIKRQVSKAWAHDPSRTPDHLVEPNTKSVLMLLERHQFKVIDYFSYSRKDPASNQSLFSRLYNRYFHLGSNLSFICKK